MPYGIEAVAWSNLVAALLAAVIAFRVLTNMLAVRIQSLLKAYVPPLISTLMMSGVIILVHHYLEAHLPPWALLVLMGTSGAVFYTALIIRISPRAAKNTLANIKLALNPAGRW
jgi:hypothetical protein